MSFQLPAYEPSSSITSMQKNYHNIVYQEQAADAVIPIKIQDIKVTKDVKRQCIASCLGNSCSAWGARGKEGQPHCPPGYLNKVERMISPKLKLKNLKQVSRALK
nr:hypothetical protein [Tanacetum cinerariifolium]